MRRLFDQQLNIQLGAKLRLARTFRHLSQAALGAELGVVGQQIGDYERGRTDLTCSAIVKFSRVLGVKPEWFFEGLAAAPKLGETPPLLDAWQRKLLEAYDRIDDPDVCKLFVLFIDDLADTLNRRVTAPATTVVVSLHDRKEAAHG